MDPRRAIEHGLSFQTLSTNYHTSLPKEMNRTGCWRPLEWGTFKLNINGITFFDLQAIGMGLRGSSGEVIMAASIWENVYFNSKTVECLALFRGFQLCLNLGIHNLVVEFDCQTLVKELQSKELSTSFVGNIIQDLKDMMTHFHVCLINFGYCQSNIAAHKLARFVYNVENIVLWYGVTPKFLYSPYGLREHSVTRTIMLNEVLYLFYYQKEKKRSAICWCEMCCVTPR